MEGSYSERRPRSRSRSRSQYTSSRSQSPESRPRSSSRSRSRSRSRSSSRPRSSSRSPESRAATPPAAAPPPAAEPEQEHTLAAPDDDNLNTLYTNWCTLEGKGESILEMTARKLKEDGFQDIEISLPLMTEFNYVLANIVRKPNLVKSYSDALSRDEFPLGKEVSLENAKLYKTEKDKLLTRHRILVNQGNANEMLIFIKDESISLSENINRCFLNERIVEGTSLQPVALEDRDANIESTIKILSNIVLNKHTDDYYPIDIFPFNRIGLAIKQDAIKTTINGIASVLVVKTVAIIKKLIGFISDYLTGYIESTTTYQKMYALYGFLNKLANSDGLEILLSLLIGACAPYFSLKPREKEHTHGLLLYRGLIIFLLQLANSTPGLTLGGGDGDVKEDGLNRGYDMFQVILNKDPGDPLYRRIMRDGKCNTALNAWLTNFIYANFRYANFNNSKGNAIILPDVPLAERGSRGRGADLSGSNTSQSRTSEAANLEQHQQQAEASRMADDDGDDMMDDEVILFAPPIEGAQSKKKKTRRRRKSKGKNSTKGKKKKGKKKTRRGRKEK
jgi:hypothetical protein